MNAKTFFFTHWTYMYLNQAIKLLHFIPNMKNVFFSIVPKNIVHLKWLHSLFLKLVFGWHVEILNFARKKEIACMVSMRERIKNWDSYM